MIEVIYKEDKEDQETVQEPFSMPRNVRQIGLTNGDYRIYVEDYVYTFLSSLAEEEKAEGRGMAAVLTGEILWMRLRNISTFQKRSGNSFRMIKNSIFRSRKLWDGFLHSGRWYWR